MLDPTPACRRVRKRQGDPIPIKYVSSRWRRRQSRSWPHARVTDAFLRGAHEGRQHVGWYKWGGIWWAWWRYVGSTKAGPRRMAASAG